MITPCRSKGRFRVTEIIQKTTYLNKYLRSVFSFDIFLVASIL